MLEESLFLGWLFMVHSDCFTSPTTCQTYTHTHLCTPHPYLIFFIFWYMDIQRVLHRTSHYFCLHGLCFWYLTFALGRVVKMHFTMLWATNVLCCFLEIKSLKDRGTWVKTLMEDLYFIKSCSGAAEQLFSSLVHG